MPYQYNHHAMLSSMQIIKFKFKWLLSSLPFTTLKFKRDFVIIINVECFFVIKIFFNQIVTRMASDKIMI